MNLLSAEGAFRHKCRRLLRTSLTLILLTSLWWTASQVLHSLMRGKHMKQYEAVEIALENLGGIGTLGQLNVEVF